MKITDGREATLPYIQQYQKNDAPRGVNTPGTTQGSLMPEEKVDLSAQAKEYRAVKELVDKTPEIREEKIRELQRRIDSGSYRVPAEDIAKKIVGDNLLDLFA